MADIQSFNETLNALLNSNPHARNKGDVFKDWFKENFSLDARISHIREQRQTTNRVSEQFRYFEPVVVFVCDSAVKREELIRYIFERTYEQMQAVAIIGVTPSEFNTNYNYTYEHLFVFKSSGFSLWASNFFENVYDANAIRNLKGDNHNGKCNFLQKIYYGAPGTGKSNEIKLLTGEGKDGIKFSKNFTFRTTFHPDSDYSSFVGCYKPTQKERIVIYKTWEELKQIADNLPSDNGDKVKAIVKFIRENAESIKKVIDEKDYGNFSYIFGGSSQESDNQEGERFCWSSNSYLGSFLEEILKEREENSNGQLTYAFTPQAFTKAYVAAWMHPDKNVALVIEEINRGNCAQIFGDIFQLLDRDKNGLSKYPIEADIDMQAYLNKQFAKLDDIFDDKRQAAINNYYKDHYDTAYNDIKCGKILSLPTNLSILCTMNTSDQSLFPMDSAFKRRWDWQYMPIKDGGLGWKIDLDENHVAIDWWDFLKRINKVVADLTTSEDKQLGYFFCQPDSFVEKEGARGYNDKPNLITAKHFVDKVIFYLWNDVFKDYAFDASCCKDGNGKEVLFAQFYNEDGKSVNIDTLKHFFESLQSDNEPSLIQEISTKNQDEPEAE